MSTQNLPKHIGIIMDGNRRWAKAKGLPTLRGHQKGYETALKIVDHAFDRGIQSITLFAFSTENWNRSKAEVSYLMALILKMIKKQSEKLHKRGVRLSIIGSEDHVPKKVAAAIKQAEDLTVKNHKGTLQIAFNYGGRHEIVDALRSLVHKKAPITETSISEHLYTAGIPDPDLIIRTSGEQRLSGFLLWQAAYSELYFTKVNWPAFTPKDFDAAIEEFKSRKRRFGK
jgi:undecaprenyl diphosphate synthase